MGNCQAIDNASLVIQHPCGKVEQLYWPIAASEVMKMNPGHYVALLLTTTLYPSTAAAGRGGSTAMSSSCATSSSAKNPVRITRIKLLRHTDTLALGHAYRLITTQEVMKGVLAKKYAKMKKKQTESSESMMKDDQESVSDLDSTETTTLLDKANNHQGNKHERQRTRTSMRSWHPSLQSITESST